MTRRALLLLAATLTCTAPLCAHAHEGGPLNVSHQYILGPQGPIRKGQYSSGAPATLPLSGGTSASARPTLVQRKASSPSASRARTDAQRGLMEYGGR
jgi:hypothetical protein